MAKRKPVARKKEVVTPEYKALLAYRAAKKKRYKEAGKRLQAWHKAHPNARKEIAKRRKSRIRKVKESHSRAADSVTYEKPFEGSIEENVDALVAFANEDILAKAYLIKCQFKGEDGSRQWVSTVIMANLERCRNDAIERIENFSVAFVSGQGMIEEMVIAITIYHRINT